MRPPSPPLLHRPIPLATRTRELRPPDVRRTLSSNISNRYHPRRSVHYDDRKPELALHVDIPGSGHSTVVRQPGVVDG